MWYNEFLSVSISNLFFSIRSLVLVLTILLASGNLSAQKKAATALPVSLGSDGKLVYIPDARGNRIPDFSYSGYRAGEHPIPDAPVRIVVPVSQGDATVRIQMALNYVSSLPPDKNGIRGVVLLEPGQYEIEGSLRIASSGVVLRGSGMNEGGTVLIGKGQGRETLIRIAGKDDRTTSAPVAITDAYVPVNVLQFHVTAAHSLKVGDHVIIHRPSTPEWIRQLGMEEFGGETGWLGWKPGQRDLFWDRKIVAVTGSAITIDAPVTTALDSAYGGGTISTYQWPGRIEQVGVENLRCVSTYDTNNAKDEDHRWMAITLEHTRDAWVRQVVFEHFAGSAVAAYETTSRVTVEDCISLAPVSEIGGQRRYTFFTTGQQVLFQRLYAEHGYHDFGTGFCAAGPNAFVQCQSYLPHNFSGAIDSWASGVLFDIVNVDGHALGFQNRRQDAQGAGWTAANSVLWQCTAARIDCYKPPTAQNWAFGAWSQFAGDGYWGEPNNHVKPRSLYYAQLAERLKQNDITQRAHLLPMETEASSSPTAEQAAALTARAVKRETTLKEWIEQAPRRTRLPTDASRVKTIDQVGYTQTAVAYQSVPLEIQHGWLSRGKVVLTGKRQDVSWWRGDARPFEWKKAKSHVTRFVPGRTGNGLTDDLEAMTDQMQHSGTVALEHNYGLWYERRRDDHERVRRMDSEVWPPFYELPFARSGQGTAWDGLSRYDLTQYNPWYWSRLQRFATLADRKGLVLIHQHYFQHNILEAGAHWADSPWRPANNINETGFPEPPPYAGDKRIFMAEQFYDISHPVRRQLHRAYIRQCLENFKENSGVIHFVSAEYTGPLHFVQFWLDVISEWEKETGKSVLIGLSTTKDVQDGILADPVRNSVVDLIDIRYWHYREDGSLYAPVGGQNLALRQHARLVKPGRTSADQVYRMVSEYRQRYPGKAVIYSGEGYDRFGWAAFMAGGSLTNLPETLPEFLAAADTMVPMDLPGGSKGVWGLANAGNGYILYCDGSAPVKLDLNDASGTFVAHWIDPENGDEIKRERIGGGKPVELKSPVTKAVVLWLSRR